MSSLELTGNQIEFIDDHAFDQLNFLTFLGLESNRLNTTPTLSGLVSLKTLDLSYNNLTILEANAFSQAESLEYVWLSNNQLITVHKQAFNGTFELEQIDLSNNNLSELDPDTFARFSNIRNIDLMNNQLEVFDGLNCSDLAICYVFLANNQLSSVRNLHLSAYDKVDLFGNNLKSLDDFKCDING